MLRKKCEKGQGAVGRILAHEISLLCFKKNTHISIHVDLNRYFSSVIFQEINHLAKCTDNLSHSNSPSQAIVEFWAKITSITTSAASTKRTP